ncbi:MAG: ectonucleotide pyrophosphatase/phosphodiesterase [Bacteroidia bacterium]|nr:ectonucleotide pyrophosphatase/phosphodiesterase [Bacteroidia bacterium]
MKKTLSIILTATFFLTISFGFRKDKEKPYKSYVVMVSMDAFRWDYNMIYNTPNLNKLAEDGVKAGRLIPSFPTVTFPNHYTIATGLYPDHHGLVNNNFPAPELGLYYRIGDRTAVENPAFYGGEPIWNTAETQGIRSASFYWAGSEAPIGGMHPTYWKRFDEAVPFGSRIDTVIKWLSYPMEKRPGFVTLYFEEPDAVSHGAGPVSPETGKMVERLDSLIGVLRLKLSELPYSKRINLIVLSDHGMSPVSPKRYINIKNLIPERMIAGIFGGNPVYTINPAEGKTDSVLFLLNKEKGLKAYRKSEVPVRWHYGTNPRIPEVVIVADSSWSIGTRPDGSGIRGGAHGYDNANTDMHAIFYAAGPAFKEGLSFDRLNNVDIYNLICKILKLKPAPNDGDIQNIKYLLK